MASGEITVNVRLDLGVVELLDALKCATTADVDGGCWCPPDPRFASDNVGHHPLRCRPIRDALARMEFGRAEATLVSEEGKT